ncbi:MAG: hypothetical protein IIV54_01625 [Bacteroidaceae bacterium]|nr:hypothetical protein [Bacteroidaceae bacterium]
MKRFLVLLTLPFLLLGCANYPVAQQGGKEDIAYLLFVSSGQYANQEVQVQIDGVPSFSAKVVKQKKSHAKGTQYGVATGARHIKVVSGGKVVYQKKLLLSTQEVKQIIL